MLRRRSKPRGAGVVVVRREGLGVSFVFEVVAWSVVEDTEEVAVCASARSSLGVRASPMEQLMKTRAGGRSTALPLPFGSVGGGGGTLRTDERKEESRSILPL